MEFIAELLFYLAPFYGLLAVGAFIADYIFPRIKPLERWIDSLPMMQDESEESDDEQ